MKLLIVTQVVDTEDPVLGFFHRWIEELSRHAESINVICLKEGKHNLPDHVHIHSLGKESGKGRVTYIIRFLTYIFSFREKYNSVFVHMNQEYILLGGLIWKLLGKHIYLWRNHHSGSIVTDIAAAFCRKVFCTSKFSYTAKYDKTVYMPVGIDMDTFYPRTSIERQKNTLLFIARISPTKRLDIILEALLTLKEKGKNLHLDVYGEPREEHAQYLKDLSAYALAHELDVEFHGAVKHAQTPQLYTRSDICINMSTNGMYDKTIFEAMACGCLSVASNDNLIGLIDDVFIVRQEDSHDLAQKLAYLLDLSQERKDNYRRVLREIAMKHHSLKALGQNLTNEMEYE